MLKSSILQSKQLDSGVKDVKQIEELLIKYINRMGAEERDGGGLFLLDLPTGFGKTTAVINIIADFFETPITKVNDNERSGTQHIFFVTNLKKNLPIDELKEKFGDKYNNYCLFLKPYWEDLVEKFNSTLIDDLRIISSDEYKLLRVDIDQLNNYKEQRVLLEKNKKDNVKLLSIIKKSIKTYESKIEKDTEPKFRYLVKKVCFEGSSKSEKQKMLKNNRWISDLYPICNMEKYRIILSTTKKFFLPIDTFYRRPFYFYDDQISRNSIVFFDEFDATKETLLDQIIEDSLKIQIDAVKLFLNIHYSLGNLKLPKKVYVSSEKLTEKVSKGEWSSVEEIIAKSRKIFDKIYDENNLDHLLKSTGFPHRKAFLFDDRHHILVNKGNKKYLRTQFNAEGNITDIIAENLKASTKKNLIDILREIKGAITYFTNGLTYIAENYQMVKNAKKDNGGNRFFFEEAVETMFSAFNISEEFKPYLFKRIIEYDARLATYEEDSPTEDHFMRKGFEFTEVEDSNDHDLQSKIHLFKFSTTPEDILIRLCHRAKVIGVSATASLETCTGNYDLGYIKKQIKDRYFEIEKEDSDVIKNRFLETQEIYSSNSVKMHTEIVDESQSYDIKDRIEDLLKKLFTGEKLKKYLAELHNPGLKLYYHFILIKLGYLYKSVGLNKNINSFLCFLNLFPKRGGFIDKDSLDKLFIDVAEENSFKKYEYKILYSEDFDEELDTIHSKFNQNEKVFLISTYKTIGMGKNIQYEIPESIKDSIILDKEGYNNQKDFDGIYLSSPTYLVQYLNRESSDKYEDLSKFLFQQEYLYHGKKIEYYQLKQNIENAFRTTFYGEQAHFTTRNEDWFLNNARVIIQAVGRICRCRNKNKNTYIFSDSDIIDRLKQVETTLRSRNLNKEFEALLDVQTRENDVKLIEASAINRAAYVTIRNAASQVRNSKANIDEWKSLRDYVLRNPTSDLILECWRGLYFHFDEKIDGYNYRLNRAKDFKRISFKNHFFNDQEVSASDSELYQLLKYDEIKILFNKHNYAQTFKKNNYIMTPSLYNQVYKGALGEVIGKCVIEAKLGINLEEITDPHFYEFFDFKYKNIYFDFKDWNNFDRDNIEYQKKIRDKLHMINGVKCIVINIIKRGEHKINISDDNSIIKIPFLLDFNNESYNEDAIKMIESSILE